LSTTKEKLEQIISNYGLFNLDEEFFWSESLLRRMEERDSKVRKAKESAQKRWEDYYAKQEQSPVNPIEAHSDKDCKNIAEETLSESYAFAEEPYSESSAIKGKEKKGKEIKEKEILSSFPPKSEISEEGKEFAGFFKELLPPTQRVTDSDLKNWGDTFDKLVRIDKRPVEEIYQIAEWARKDSFWGEMGNFLSACKLRSKNKDGVLFYDIFLQKFLRERSKSNGTTGSVQQVQRPAWITAKE